MNIIKVPKTDYITQKEMLTGCVGKEIVYKGVVYKLLDFLDIKIESSDNILHDVQCLLIDENGKLCEVPIEYIFEVCFPQCCKDWSKLPPFSRI